MIGIPVHHPPFAIIFFAIPPSHLLPFPPSTSAASFSNAAPTRPPLEMFFRAFVPQQRSYYEIPHKSIIVLRGRLRHSWPFYSRQVMEPILHNPQSTLLSFLTHKISWLQQLIAPASSQQHHSLSLVCFSCPTENKTYPSHYVVPHPIAQRPTSLCPLHLPRRPRSSTARPAYSQTCNTKQNDTTQQHTNYFSCKHANVHGERTHAAFIYGPATLYTN